MFSVPNNSNNHNHNNNNNNNNNNDNDNDNDNNNNNSSNNSNSNSNTKQHGHQHQHQHRHYCVRSTSKGVHKAMNCNPGLPSWFLEFGRFLVLVTVFSWMIFAGAGNWGLDGVMDVERRLNPVKPSESQWFLVFFCDSYREG